MQILMEIKSLVEIVLNLIGVGFGSQRRQNNERKN